MAANKIKLKNLSKKSHKGAKRSLELLRKPDLLLSTILVGNNFDDLTLNAKTARQIYDTNYQFAKPPEKPQAKPQHHTKQLGNMN
jgi:CBS domain containing-hemolysin-like protein